MKKKSKMWLIRAEELKFENFEYIPLYEALFIHVIYQTKLMIVTEVMNIY